MGEQPAKYDFDPPTRPVLEPVYDYSELIPVVDPPVDKPEENAFALFESRAKQWAAQGVRPQLMVRAIQHVAATRLNDKDLKNMHGWAREETDRLTGVYQANLDKTIRATRIKTRLGSTSMQAEIEPERKRA